MRDPVLAVIQRLLADSAVSGVVGTRVYRKVLPVGWSPSTGPTITVARVDNLRNNANNRLRYANSRVQCTSWASTDVVADNLSELIANSLNVQVNTIFGTAPNDVLIIGCEDVGTVPDSNPDIPVFMYHRDFMIEYSYI